MNIVVHYNGLVRNVEADEFPQDMNAYVNQVAKDFDELHQILLMRVEAAGGTVFKALEWGISHEMVRAAILRGFDFWRGWKPYAVMKDGGTIRPEAA